MASRPLQQPILKAPDEQADADDKATAKPWPLAAKAAVLMTVVLTITTVIVGCLYGLGPIMKETDPKEVKLFHRAKVMLLPALLLESCYLISSRNGSKQLKLTGSEMSYLVILEYAAKMISYSMMAYFQGGLVHVNLRAHGPVRGCYAFRFLEWAIAVPALLVINNFPLAGKQDVATFVRRLGPNLVLTFTYCASSWVAQVTPNPVAGWALVILSLLGLMTTVWDQWAFVHEVGKDIGKMDFRILVVVFKDVSFASYGLVYLLGISNVMSSLSEQMFYTYGDVMVKVVQASMLVVVRNWEDLAELQSALEVKVQLGKEDRRRLFHCANAPIFAITPAGTVAAWNEHIEKVSGVREEDAVGKSILDLVDVGSRERLKKAIDSCDGGASSGSVEIAMQPQSPEQPPVQMLVALIEQLGGDTVKTITAIGQDLTEVTAMKAMNERKARFTAVLGHELRSPLHGIMGLSGSMAQGTSNTMQKRQLTMIKGCAARLLDLVTNIMEMAKAEKLESGPAGEKQALDRRPVNLMDIVDEVIGMTEQAVDKNGRHLVGSNVRLVNHMNNGKLPVVMGDSYKITQLLYNLVTNAAKFTVAGSIQFSAREDQPKGMIEIDVADTGKGIEPAAMKRIFEPFQQTENKDSRSFQGIGLGLSVAMGVARLHGGEIRVMSKCGQGSTFTVVLPCDFSTYKGLTLRRVDSDGAGNRATDEKAAASAEQRRVLRGGAVPPTGQRPLALSVDDDDINQEVIEQTLGSEYRIERAMNGMEALAYLESGKEFPSIMLLDVMMPGMTGFEVVKEVRNTRNLAHTDLPVVMLSARSPQEATANEAFGNGATDYMQKPFSAALLKHRLNLIHEVRQEVRKAELGAVEAYKQQKAKKTPTDQKLPPPEPEAQPEGKAPQAKEPAAEELAKVEDAAASAARVEAISKLTEERDQIRARLEAKQDETAKANAELERLVGDRDRLKAEIAATVGAAAVAAKAAAATAQAAPPTPMESSRFGSASATAELNFGQARVAFYQAEVQLRDGQIAELRQKLDEYKSDAYLHRRRAEAIERELRFVRQLGSRLSADLP